MIKSKKGIIEIKCEDHEEIIQKVAHIPKWKHKDVSGTEKCLASMGKMLSTLTASTEVLIPLSPLQIYNVRMYPTLFAFGMVST